MKIKLPLRKSENPSYRYPAKPARTPYYPYVYIIREAIVVFVDTDIGTDRFRVPGVICPRS